jgi:membrane-associated protease RseP (regulator of RpoE activity)
MTWAAFYLTANILKLDKRGLNVHPLYMMYRSTALNSFITRLGKWNPKFWKVFGNIGIASFFGQVIFMSYILFQNLYRFLFIPKQASPVMPLIPGVTISFQSLPWFLAAAGVVILFHELSHGILAVAEGIHVKNAVLLVAVVTFGAAIEPDEDEFKASRMLSKLRLLAAGSLVNLIIGLITIAIFFFLGSRLPEALGLFLHWLYFISINLALANMLPVYPLDGGQMVRTFLSSKPRWGKSMERLTMGSFLALMASNLIFSLVKFGLIPL